MMTCTRCNNERLTMTIFATRVGGHSLPSLKQPALEAIAPLVERVCGDCVTDVEILRELVPVVDFALSTLMSSDPASPNVTALETVRAYFNVYNVADDGRTRRAALQAIGLTATKSPASAKGAG